MAEVDRRRRFASRQVRGEVFPNAACVVSLVDRLMHRAEVVRIEGESYRANDWLRVFQKSECVWKMRPRWFCARSQGASKIRNQSGSKRASAGDKGTNHCVSEIRATGTPRVSPAQREFANCSPLLKSQKGSTNRSAGLARNALFETLNCRVVGCQALPARLAMQGLGKVLEVHTVNSRPLLVQARRYPPSPLCRMHAGCS